MTITEDEYEVGEEEPEEEPLQGFFPCPEPGCDYLGKQQQHLDMHVERRHHVSEAPQIPSERAPKPPKRSGGFVDRMKGRFGKGSSQTGPAQPAKKKKPVARKGPRQSVAGDLSGAYFWLGSRLEYTPQYPVGRMMTWQAPAAGEIIDEALAGTMLDRVVIQPLWRSKDKWENVAFLVGPPTVIYMIQGARIKQRQALQEGDNETAQKIQGWIMLQLELLSAILRSSATKLAPMIAEAKQRKAEEDEALREAFGDSFGDMPPGTDPIRIMIDGLFAPPGTVGNMNNNHQPEEENVGYPN